MRRIFFPAHVTPANILEMVQHCTKVTHLSLPRNLGLDHLVEIIDTMKHLQQLDVFVKEAHHMESLLEKIKQQGNSQGNSLPSVINVYVCLIYCKVDNLLLQFWSTWNFKLPSFKVGLYDITRVSMNLYPSIPLMKFQQQHLLLLNSLIMAHWVYNMTHFISLIMIIMVRSEIV